MVMSAQIEVTPDAQQRAPRPGFWRTVKAYVALTKPRVMELLLVVTVPAMILAQGGLPNLWLEIGRASCRERV